MLLMMISIEPEIQHTVDELMSTPEDFSDASVFVRGNVVGNSTNFQSYEFQITGETHHLLVNFSNAAIPDGFHDDRTIAIRGILSFDGLNWVLNATEIQTGCPSKYEI
tara:strand:+ start:94080 stop:94403 length:324 start_codon:yes stop_codon:yes gene_type:complete